MSIRTDSVWPVSNGGSRTNSRRGALAVAMVIVTMLNAIIVTQPMLGAAVDPKMRVRESAVLAQDALRSRLHVQSDNTTPTTTSPTATVPAPSAVTPVSYVNEALDFIESASYRRVSADWVSIRTNAQIRAANARNIDEAYQVIVDTIKALLDNHSSFTRPAEALQQSSGNYSGFGFVAVWPSRIVVTLAAGAPAANSGMRTGDRVTKIDGKSPVHNDTNIVVPRTKRGDFPDQIVVTITRKGAKKAINLLMNVGNVTLISVPTASVIQTKPKIGQTVGGVYGYLDVPGIVGDADAQKTYAQALQDAIRGTDSTKRCGWIVDLRRNRGGYIYAMLNGLGPLLGTGPVGGQLNAATQRTLWTYTNGTLFSGDTSTVSIDQPYSGVDENVPVAVLTSGLTASAGEATTIAFRNRTNSRSFGEKTYGLTTFNVRKRMSDGAFLDILNAVDIDRIGTIYDGPVAPEQSVAIDWNNLGNESDPVLTAATQWLSNQSSCSPSKSG